MNITITLTDDVTTATLELPEVPLAEETINNDVEVITLDNNISVYIVPDSDKRVWAHTWAYLSEADFNVLKGFRDRQRTLYKYPRVTITGVNPAVTDVPVYMKLSPKNIIDDCATVENVEIILRESTQMPTWGS